MWIFSVVSPQQQALKVSLFLCGTPVYSLFPKSEMLMFSMEHYYKLFKFLQLFKFINLGYFWMRACYFGRIYSKTEAWWYKHCSLMLFRAQRSASIHYNFFQLLSSSILWVILSDHTILFCLGVPIITFYMVILINFINKHQGTE